MNLKQKRVGDLAPEKVKRFLMRLVNAASSVFMFTILATAVSILVVSMLQHTRDSSPYRFCLAAELSDSCVHRPGIVIGNKISKTPDKLLKFFGGIPERVQRQWRVWIMDVENSKTIELTVAEFYAWIDGTWNAHDRAGGGT